MKFESAATSLGPQLTDKRIGSALGSDLCFRSVAGKNGDVITEREQFFSDPVYQQINIAAGQITAADAAGKKNIAADQQFVLARKETKTSRAMAGNFQNFEIDAEKISALRFLDEKIRFRRFDFELEPKIAKKFAIANHGRCERVTTDGTAELALEPGNILHVIDVPMCQEQEFEIGVKRTHPFASSLGRVEENPALWRLKQIAIRFKNAAAKALVIHRD